MKTLLALCALIAAAAAAVSDVHSEWGNFKLTHLKEYDTPEEEQKRLDIFHENLRVIQEQNAKYEAGEDTHLLGITAFADLTDEEFVEITRCRNQDYQTSASVPVFKSSGFKAPASLDWRTHTPMIVQPPRSQGGCGSCWAHAAAEIVESSFSLRVNSTYFPLGPQNLVNCVPYHCNGSTTSRALDYIKKSGVALESACPYTGVQAACTRYPGSELFITQYTSIKTENDMKEALVKKGPIGVSVDAKEWKLYTKGIFKAAQPFKQLTHDLVADGYGTENGEDYWLLRNSWGPNWGEKGYIRIRRNTNEFGITTDVVAIDA